MDPLKEHICPWCQTHIQWDPDIGPEEECPHCFNQLDGYRSINLTLKKTGKPVAMDENEEIEGFGFGDETEFDSYDEKVQQHIDRQEEAPECPSCHEFMLFAGTRRVHIDDFEPAASPVLSKPFLEAPFQLNLFVCPSCFRVENILSEEDRTVMVRAFRDSD